MELQRWPALCETSGRGRALGADVVVVSEIPKIPLALNGLWIGDDGKKGLAVIANRHTRLEKLAGIPELPRFVLPVYVRGEASFLLVAVWTKAEGTDTYVRGLHRALTLCEAHISSQPTVVLHEHPADRNHSALVKRLDDLGLVSAYHARFDERHGSETRPTYFQYGHDAKPYHIDYCFLPKSWEPTIRDVSVGSFAQRTTKSDHVPLVVDLDAESNGRTTTPEAL